MRDLVLLPGFMCDEDLWTDMVLDLKAIGRIHYGNVYEDSTLEGMAERALGHTPERFVLVGFSMGGFVARVLTLMAPKRVKGVASSACGYSDEERKRRQAGYGPGGRPPRAGSGALHGRDTNFQRSGERFPGKSRSGTSKATTPALAARSLWAMAGDLRPGNNDFFPRPLPIIGVRRVIMQSRAHDDDDRAAPAVAPGPEIPMASAVQPPTPEQGVFSGGKVGGLVDSWPETLVPSASNRSTPEWTPVDSVDARQGRFDEKQLRATPPCS